MKSSRLLNDSDKLSDSSDEKDASHRPILFGNADKQGQGTEMASPATIWFIKKVRKTILLGLPRLGGPSWRAVYPLTFERLTQSKRRFCRYHPSDIGSSSACARRSGRRSLSSRGRLSKSALIFKCVASCNQLHPSTQQKARVCCFGYRIRSYNAFRPLVSFPSHRVSNDSSAWIGIGPGEGLGDFGVGADVLADLAGEVGDRSEYAASQ